jgi:integrase
MKKDSPATTYLATLGPGSQRAMAQALATLVGLAGARPETDPADFDWSAIDGDSALAIRRQLTEQYAPATTNKMLAALRGVMRAARDLGLIDEARYQQVARIRSVKVVPVDDEVILTQAQLRKLFKSTAADLGATGRRDAAILATILATGLRRGEAVELNLDNLDMRGGHLHVAGETADRVRTSPLDSGALAAMADWVEVRGDDPGPLFLPTVRGGALRLRRMTDQALYLLIKQIGVRAGMPELTSRMLRRTMIVRAIAGGADRDALTQRAGHMSWLNARAFDDLADLAKRRRIKDEPLPYVPPRNNSQHYGSIHPNERSVSS